MDTVQPIENSLDAAQISRVVCCSHKTATSTWLESLRSAGIRSFFLFYRKGIRVFLHAFGYSGCRFEPSCSCYAEELLQDEISVKNVEKIIARIGRCNAWTTPHLTYDPPFEELKQQ